MGWAARQPKPGRRSKPTDPAIRPIAGSSRWVESGPEPILDDAKTATLIVRVGMATNALYAHIHAGRDASRSRQGAAKMRDLLSSLVVASATTNEATVLASEGMATLRPLARRAGAKEELLVRVGKLCAGKDPASPLLKRMRNKLGFHWDEEIIGQSVREYGRNRRLVWIESQNDTQQTTHRMAVEVLTHVLFPGGASREIVRSAINEIDTAMDTMIEFFTAATYGYLHSIGADARRR